MRILLFISLLFLAHQSEPAPDFEFLTAEGEIKSLSDYEGQVVYMSFWASWCGPCIKNFKKYQPLRNQLEKEGVVLLNVSIDKKIEAWHTALEKNTTLNGINVRPTDPVSVNSLYSISKIPDYHIINKEGNFVYLSEDPNRDILKEFQAWIKE